MSERKRIPLWQLKNSMIHHDLIPRTEQYVRYRGANSNYGAHSMMFEFLGIRFWFSYETMIAFQFPGEKVVKRHNSWGPTTGRHLSSIPGNDWDEFGETRLPENEFMVIFANMCKKHGLSKHAKFAVELEPGTWNRTGYITHYRPHRDIDPIELPRNKKEADVKEIALPKLTKREEQQKRGRERRARWAKTRKLRATLRQKRREKREQERQLRQERRAREQKERTIRKLEESFAKSRGYVNNPVAVLW